VKEKGGRARVRKGTQEKEAMVVVEKEGLPKRREETYGG